MTVTVSPCTSASRAAEPYRFGHRRRTTTRLAVALGAAVLALRGGRAGADELPARLLQFTNSSVVQANSRAVANELRARYVERIYERDEPLFARNFYAGFAGVALSPAQVRPSVGVELQPLSVLTLGVSYQPQRPGREVLAGNQAGRRLRRPLLDAAQDGRLWRDQADLKRDVVWFKLPQPEGWPDTYTNVRIIRGNHLIILPCRPNLLRVGLYMPNGGFRAFKQLGLDNFHREIVRLEPRFAGVVEQHVTSWQDVSLLDIFTAVVEGLGARRPALDR